MVSLLTAQLGGMHWASLRWWTSQVLLEKLLATSTMTPLKPAHALSRRGSAHTTALGSGHHCVGQFAARLLFCVASSLGKTSETSGPREDLQGR